jgi:outer membrane protein assembly factor BamB
VTRRLWPAWLAAATLCACSSGSTSSTSSTGGAAANASQSPSNAGTTAATSSTPEGQLGDWLTYHASGARTGVGQATPALSPSGVHAAWTSARLDGNVYAEPLDDGGRVVVATEQGTLYGLEAATGRQLWQRHIADPETGRLPCGNITPLGITGTPAIDPASHTVFAVAEKTDGEHLLAAVDDRTGDFLWQRAIDPPGSDPNVQQQRAALAVTGGNVYVAFGGLFGDCGGYHGWVVGVALDGGGPLLTYEVPSQREAGIWAPSGIAVGGDGSLYVATGNGASSTAYDHGNALIRLDLSLHELAFTAPSNWAELSSTDTDLGSTGPVLLPGGLVAVASKEGKLHVSAVDRLRGVGAELGASQLGDGAYGGMAAQGSRVFVPCTDGLRAADVDSAGHASVAWEGPPLRPPIAAFGAIWAVDLNGDRLHALDPASGRELAALTVGGTVNFTTPTAGSGLVIVAATDRIVAVAPA